MASDPASQLWNTLRHHSQHVLKYEQWDLQERARAVVPVDELHRRAHANEPQQRSPQSPPLDFQDLVIKELLHWFKHEFFQWVNEAPCERGCPGKTQPRGHTRGQGDELLRYGAELVELYQCSTCQHTTRFPRYNDPGVLLTEGNRRGRCGEWANAFTLLVRAMGYDARHVVDWSDHVWTEYYSEHQQRWIHLDSCEAAYDAPLLYEQGWRKKLSLIVAFSADETVDVTRRYSRQWVANDPEQRQRRRAIIGGDEQMLEDMLLRMNTQKLENASPEKIVFVMERAEKERQEWAVVNADATPHRAAETAGRESGSVEWRESRGETGKNT